MQTLSQIKSLLGEGGLAPRKSLGQNFLIDQNLIVRLVDAAQVGPGSLVLEIGPGTGTMTEELLARGCRVIASELDRGLADLLRRRLGFDTNFTLVEGDCLSGKSALSHDVVTALGGRPFRLVSNLPYAAGTSAMLAIMARHPECDLMAVTVQKEVGERLAAPAGSEMYGSISVVAGCTMGVTRVATLPPECFWPRPDVTSVMLTLARLPEPLTDDALALAEFCKRAFAGRRKQLRGLLKSMGLEGLDLPPGVAPESRIESLTPTQISTLERTARARYSPREDAAQAARTSDTDPDRGDGPDRP